MPANDSPFWPILRIAVVSAAAIVAVSIGYGEGWVARSDVPVVLSIAASLLGVEGFKRKFAKEK